MSIGKSGIRNLAFVQDDSEDASETVSKSSADRLSAGLEPLRRESPLYKGKDITARGYILILSLAATMFAGRTPSLN